jgi:hypothetical protein
MLHHRKIVIKKLDNNRYSLAWYHDREIIDLDDRQVLVEASKITCEDEYDLLAMIIDPYKIDFDKLKTDTIRTHTQDLSADWYTEEEYCERNNITKGILKEKVKEGKVSELKIQGITFVSDKAN